MLLRLRMNFSKSSTLLKNCLGVGVPVRFNAGSLTFIFVRELTLLSRFRRCFIEQEREAETEREEKRSEERVEIALFVALCTSRQSRATRLGAAWRDVPLYRKSTSTFPGAALSCFLEVVGLTALKCLGLERPYHLFSRHAVV